MSKPWVLSVIARDAMDAEQLRIETPYNFPADVRIQCRKDSDAAIIAVAELIAALRRAERLFNEALPKFNWSASTLDANAIQLLNEVPGEVHAALVAVTKDLSHG